MGGRPPIRVDWSQRVETLSLSALVQGSGTWPKASLIRRRSRIRGSVAPPTQRLTVFTDTPSIRAAASWVSHSLRSVVVIHSEKVSPWTGWPSASAREHAASAAVSVRGLATEGLCGTALAGSSARAAAMSAVGSRRGRWFKVCCHVTTAMGRAARRGHTGPADTRCGPARPAHTRAAGIPGADPWRQVDAQDVRTSEGRRPAFTQVDTSVLTTDCFALYPVRNGSSMAASAQIADGKRSHEGELSHGYLVRRGRVFL